jgi:putative restriction endonuclease
VRPGHVAEEDSSARRRYITTAARHRLHQAAFREKVLQAYQQQCALCRLRHAELLDAAHIVADAEDAGEPVVENGLALCKLHHAAFDRHFLAVRPDYRVELRRDVMEEDDGPMLRHGLQGMHGGLILLPRSRSLWPDPERLKARYEEFRRAS